MQGTDYSSKSMSVSLWFPSSDAYSSVLDASIPPLFKS